MDDLIYVYYQWNDKHGKPNSSTDVSIMRWCRLFVGLAESKQPSPPTASIFSLSRQSRVTEVGEANVSERNPDRRTREACLAEKRTENESMSERGRSRERETKSERERIGNGVEKVRRWAEGGCTSIERRATEAKIRHRRHRQQTRKGAGVFSLSPNGSRGVSGELLASPE